MNEFSQARELLPSTAFYLLSGESSLGKVVGESHHEKLAAEQGGSSLLHEMSSLGRWHWKPSAPWGDRHN